MENLDSFLKTTKKIIKKKRQLANAFKQKLNIDKQNFKTVVINTLGDSSKRELATLLLALIFEKDVKDLSIIGADMYCLVCQLKKSQVFAISIKGLEFHVKKEARPKTNTKTIVPEEYYDFLDMFSKKNSNTLFPY